MDCYEIVQANKHALMGHAADVGPSAEACGVFTHNGLLWTLTNLSEHGEFRIDPNDLLRVWAWTAAIWHTHPNGSLRPSTRDTAGHPANNVDGKRLGMVIATTDDVGVVIPW
jgi:proteasome lid subunit RPN8/RPN11